MIRTRAMCMIRGTVVRVGGGATEACSTAASTVQNGECTRGCSTGSGDVCAILESHLCLGPARVDKVLKMQPVTHKETYTPVKFWSPSLEGAHCTFFCHQQSLQ